MGTVVIPHHHQSVVVTQAVIQNLQSFVCVTLVVKLVSAVPHIVLDLLVKTISILGARLVLSIILLPTIGPQYQRYVVPTCTCISLFC